MEVETQRPTELKAVMLLSKEMCNPAALEISQHEIVARAVRCLETMFPSVLGRIRLASLRKRNAAASTAAVNAMRC